MPNITEAQAQALRAARDIPSERDRKRRKAAIFAEIKSTLKIPSSQKIKMEIDSKTSPYYCALKDGTTGDLLQPAMPAYSGARVIESLAQPKAEPVFEAAWPYPSAVKAGTPAKVASAVKPNPGFDRVASQDHRMGNTAQARDTASVMLKLGSISLEDALRLLRADGDMADSYASASGEASAELFVKNDRLFFVL